VDRGVVELVVEDV
jgi:hypothetical protein